MYNQFDRCVEHILLSKKQISDEFLYLTLDYAIKQNKIKLLVALYGREDLSSKILANITNIDNPQVLATFIEKQNTTIYDIQSKIEKNKKSAVILTALINKSNDPVFLESLINDKHKSVLRALLLNSHSPDNVLIKTILALSERSKYQIAQDKISNIINTRADLLPILAERSKYKLSRKLLYKKPVLSKQGYDNLFESLVFDPLNRIINEIPEHAYFYKPGFWGESEKLSNLYNVMRNLEILITYSNFDIATLDKVGVMLDLLFYELNLANIKKIRLFKGIEIAYDLYKSKNPSFADLFENNKTHTESEIANFDQSSQIEQAILNYLENVLTFDISTALLQNKNFNFENVNQIIIKILNYEYIKPELYYKVINLVELSAKTLKKDNKLISEYIINIIKLTYKSSNSNAVSIKKIHELFIDHEDVFFNSLLSKEVALNNRNINEIISNTNWNKEILSRSNFILLNELLSNKTELTNEVYHLMLASGVKLDFETISLLSNESELSITELIHLSNSLNR